jgi:hypothetical protein
VANPHKGEVAFEANGATYTLSFSANAICEAEEHFGRDPGEVFAEIVVDKPPPGSLKILREFFWLALGDHHPEIDFAGAKELLRHVTAHDMAMLVARAFALGMPEQKGDAPNPPQPGGPDGTGPASSKHGSRSAGTKPISGAAPRDKSNASSAATTSD